MVIEFEPNVLELRQIYESGQVFNWRRLYHRTYGMTIADVRLILIQRNNHEIEVLGSLPENCDVITAVKHYLRLDSPLTTDMLPSLPFLKEAYQRYAGVQILRQEPVTCTIGYIISQRNTVSRIMRTIAYLEDTYGNLSSMEVLACINWDKIDLGYRTAYLQRFTDWLTFGSNYSKFLELRNCETEELIWQLKQFHGIGEKVASCIALFGFDHLEVFPVDTWIQKMLNTYPELQSVIGTPYAGVVQQFAYMWARRDVQL